MKRGEGSRPRAARHSYLVPLLGGGAFIIAVIVLLVGWAIWQGRSDAHHTAEITTANLSRTLADNFNSTIHQLDLGLLPIRDEVMRQQQSGRWDEAAILAAIAREDARHPEVLGFRVIGPDGKLLVGVTNIANRGGDLSQREDFIFQRGTTEDTLTIGPPMLGPLTQQITIAVSRRFTKPDGSFGGVVICPIAVKELARTFSAIDLGKGGTVALYHTSFRIAARYPETAGPNNPAGTILVSDQLRAIIESGAPTSHYDYTSVVDGVQRTAHVRRIKGFPYVILVGQSEEGYLADWRRNSLYMLLFGAVMVGLVALGILIAHRRIAERQRANAALAESEEKLRGLFELSPLGIARTSLDGHFIEFNSAFRDITGYDERELAALDYWTLTPRSDEADEAREIESLHATGRYGPYRKEYTRKDGSTVPLLLRGMLVTGHDGQAYIWSLVEDISERVAAEAAMRIKTEALTQSNADLEQFAYVASHDLQTPLRNMVSYAQLLERRYKGRLDSDADDFIGFIVDSSKQMTLLITDLLEYSRIASQSRPPQPVSTADAIAMAMGNLKPDMESAGAEVTIGPMPRVLADPPHLISLFQNLLGNALKYRSPERKPRLSVTAERISPEFWQFAVADNGIGIDPAYHDKIFEIFQRLTPNSETSGTGIGLTVCRRIVQRLGGTMWVGSVPGEGTTFFFTLRDGGINAA